MVLQHLFPVFSLILAGILFKRYGLTNKPFLATADRLIYYIFFPALLFWKIGSARIDVTPQLLRFYMAVAGAVVIVYLASLLYIIVFNVPKYQAGAFSQSCYRFNTYIGVAIILNLFGTQGVARFGVLIGVMIPLINLLAVTTLIWFSKQPGNWRRQVGMTGRALISNPLILACLCGLLYARFEQEFPPFIDNTLSLGASVSLPLALFSIGGSLTLETLRMHLSLATVSVVLKLLVLPVLGYTLMRILDVDPVYIPVGAIFFALPTSTAIYVLSAQLSSDTAYASAAIALSTAMSFFSLSFVLWSLNA
jgi:predicted permease